MPLSIRSFQSENGERFAILVDETGMPPYYPALYVTAILRGASLAVNTIRAALTAIKVLQAWQDYSHINLESRFKRSELLLDHEVHSLRDFMQEPLATAGRRAGKIASIKRRPKTVSTKSQYNRMTIAAEYLGFLAGRLQPVSNISSSATASMVARIKANRPKISSKSNIDRDEEYLDDEVLDAIEEALKPGVGSYSTTDLGLQMRNALMFTILRLVGVRRGELLNLKIEDFDFGKNTMRIVRRPDSESDSRAYQPVAKTRQRTIPLMPELMHQVHEYILKHRRKVPAAQRHGYLFISHAGKTKGSPLSNAAFGKFIGEISKVAAEFSGIHAHALRHHWNYSFSIRGDASGISPEREAKLRSYLMGWSETSGTAATYNRRHIKEEAGKAVLGMQNKYLTKEDKGSQQ